MGQGLSLCCFRMCSRRIILGKINRRRTNTGQIPIQEMSVEFKHVQEIFRILVQIIPIKKEKRILFVNNSFG